MSWQDQLKGDSLSWLLDPETPEVRYLALRDLQGCGDDDAEFVQCAQGVDFFMGSDPAAAGYPNGWSDKPSQNWWKFGFPVFYVTDTLQNIEALAGLGYGADPRLGGAISLVREKQDSAGRWLMEYDYTGKTWVDFGPKQQPNKWVTLRALRVLKAAAAA